MGKQINYWMDYNNFLLLAQKAIDLGCTIVKEDFDSGKVIESSDISIIASFCENLPNNCCYFHLPEAGEIKTHMINGKERLELPPIRR